MAKWELAICVKDCEDLPSGHKRKKAGDIIAYKPYPQEWGSGEVSNLLIVIVDGLTEEQVFKLCIPQYSDGRETIMFLPKDLKDMTPELEAKIKERPIAKRKFKLPLDRLKQLDSRIDLERVEDVTDKYQPLKDNNVTFDVETIGNLIYDKHKDDWGDTRSVT